MNTRVIYNGSVEESQGEAGTATADPDFPGRLFVVLDIGGTLSNVRPVSVEVIDDSCEGECGHCTAPSNPLNQVQDAWENGYRFAIRQVAEG